MFGSISRMIGKLPGYLSLRTYHKTAPKTDASLLAFRIEFPYRSNPCIRFPLPLKPMHTISPTAQTHAYDFPMKWYAMAQIGTDRLQMRARKTSQKQERKDYITMSTENNETSHLNEDFSQGEDVGNLDQQELEDVNGGGGSNYIMERFLKDLKRKPVPPPLEEVPPPPGRGAGIRRTRSAPAIPNLWSNSTSKPLE